MYKENKTEILNLEELKNKKNKTKKYNIEKLCYRIIPLIFIPLFFVLTIISTHSKRLINEPLSIIIYILFSLCLYLFILGLIFIKKDKKNKKKRKRKIIFNTFIIIYVIGCSLFLFLLYGPINNFRDWFISTSMSTMSHKYLCKWFYSDEEISKVINSNYIVEVNEETDTSLIEIEQEITYENEYEKQILVHDKDEVYKIIELTVNEQKAYLAVIYDPSLVKVGTSARIGRYGNYATKIAEQHNAILATNGGGFGNSFDNRTGGVPTGVTIKNGKIISDSVYGTSVQSGGLIGMTYDNKLVMIKNATGKKALEQGVRDGVSWGPFLIVNGKKSFIKGNGGWGNAARTAIGQRQDGIILLLTVDSNGTRTKGANMIDLTEIMERYGAINAANLDGGTSTVMVLPKAEALKYIDTCNTPYCYINDPIDSTLSHKTRGIPTIIYVEKR